MQAVSVGQGMEQCEPAVAVAARERLAMSVPDRMSMVRASLMKNDSLLKALGRPVRDQIVAMRPQVLTTLEAIQLSNGPELTVLLRSGAERLLAQFPESPKELVKYVYEFALSREPTNAEWSVIEPVLGKRPCSTAVADFLWSIFLSPEFMFVR